MNTSHNNRVKTCLTYLTVFALVFLLQNSYFPRASNTQNAQHQSDNKSIDCNSSKQENTEPLPEWRGSDLHKALTRKDVVAVRNLLKLKANPNERDNYGNTPLFYAVGPKIREPKIKPAEVRRREREKEMQFQIKAVKELLKYGADPNQPGAHNVLPLIRAAAGGFGDRHTVQILTMLIGRNADVNLQDERGFTALMTAAETGSPEVVKLLLEHGADATMTNCDGKTAMSIAQSFTHSDVVRILQSTK